MWYSLPKEFQNLKKEYQDATSREDRRIKLKLNEIQGCYAECNTDEREFSDEIIKKFCELVEILKEQHQQDRQAIIDEYDELYTMPSNNEQYLSYQGNHHLYQKECMQYQSDEELLMAFYNCYVKKKSASTMKDYVARIKTFAYSDKYLGQMLLSGELGNRQVNHDQVLFTYNNIEIILARFNTKDENGISIKQRLNIRSALRMLNEFKKI